MNGMQQAIIDYYTKAGRDYLSWSRKGNMHFGFYRLGMNPFALEGMLEQMNREILSRLTADRQPRRILDLGCGLGATMRLAARTFPGARITGLTLVPWQASAAQQLAAQEGIDGVEFLVADFTRAPFEDETFDAVYALESTCYAPGSDKWAQVREMHRLLKPGGRFVLADAYLKTDRRMSRITRACYAAFCRCWALDSLGSLREVLGALARLEFQDVVATNISKNVTPSVFHVPLRTLAFGVREILPRAWRIDRRRWRHLLGGLWLMLFTIDRTRSGYFMVSGTKPLGACPAGRDR